MARNGRIAHYHTLPLSNYHSGWQQSLFFFCKIDQTKASVSSLKRKDKGANAWRPTKWMAGWTNGGFELVTGPRFSKNLGTSTGWWFFATPLNNKKVSWDDDIPNWMESHKFHVPNHQPDDVQRIEKKRSHHGFTGKGKASTYTNWGWTSTKSNFRQ